MQRELRQWRQQQAVSDRLVLSAISSRSVKSTYRDRRAQRAKYHASHPVTIRTYAHVIKVSQRHAAPEQKAPKARRGAITEFSRKSRKRMLELTASLRNANHQSTFFATLTYPGEFTWLASEVKAHLRAFQMRFKRFFTGAGVIWRLELKKRKSGKSKGMVVPHFHLIIVNAAVSWGTMMRWIRKNWYEVVGSEDEDHYKAGVDVQDVKSFRHLMHYVSKYAAKDEDDADPWERPWGRRWGAWGNVDAEPMHVIRLTARQWAMLKRLIAAWMKSKGSSYADRVKRMSPRRGCSIFGLGDEDHQYLLLRMVRHVRSLSSVN